MIAAMKVRAHVVWWRLSGSDPDKLGCRGI